MRTRWLGECSCLHSASCIDICRYVGQARPIEEHQYMEVEVNPVVVIGAGPQGLAAAAHLLERGLEPLVLESGDGPASAVSAWGHVRRRDDTERRLEAKAVVDASGTWRPPSPAGAEGLPALGEQAAVEAGLLDHRTPSREEAAELAGKHIVVVGSGHSAATAIGDLAAVVRREPGTRVTWALRRGTVGNAFGGGSADELPERGALGLRAKKAVEDGYVDLVTGFRVERVLVEDGRAVLVGEDGRRLEPADRVVVATGFRPDLSFLSEVRLDLDVRLQAPTKVATEVDPNLHSCGSVRATGATDLAHPEPGFYIVGAKSYGRAPTFLA